MFLTTAQLDKKRRLRAGAECDLLARLARQCDRRTGPDPTPSTRPGPVVRGYGTVSRARPCSDRGPWSHRATTLQEARMMLSGRAAECQCRALRLPRVCRTSAAYSPRACCDPQIHSPTKGRRTYDTSTRGTHLTEHRLKTEQVAVRGGDSRRWDVLKVRFALHLQAQLLRRSFELFLRRPRATS